MIPLASFRTTLVLDRRHDVLDAGRTRWVPRQPPRFLVVLVGTTVPFSAPVEGLGE